MFERDEMENYTLNMEQYALLARSAVAEGCVLLKNQREALPLRHGESVALFGRGNFNYYKSGLGSGGLVNTSYVVSVLDALKETEKIKLNTELIGIYEDWIQMHPFDAGNGWGTVPWSQQEMPVTARMLEIAESSDVSVVTIARTAGEDQDNNSGAGSFLLTDTEKEMLQLVSAHAKRTVVLLNVGNIIDMNWMNDCDADAVLYIWQGGQEGGNGVLDLLLGEVSPSGRLADTIAFSVQDYPSDAYFGDQVRNFYAEDIYVGYRYFETFAPDRVMFPFGFGLSYTTFDVSAALEWVTEKELYISADVTNTGTHAGKNAVLVYLSCPQGKLGQPVRKLAGFAKTGVLQPGETQRLEIRIQKAIFAGFDDAGAVAKNAFVLEEGLYTVYVGGDVQSGVPVGEYRQKEEIVEQLSEAYAPTRAFRRMRPIRLADGYEVGFEETPLRTVSLDERVQAELPEEIPYTGDQGKRLIDVYDGKVSLRDFTAQVKDEDLIAIFRGEGMCSPKVTPGTAGAFGGVTDALKALGVPVACCADGPSGIRMDCGTKAFSLPNGAIFACSFNEEISEDLFAMLGRELRLNRIDSLLGPGMNLHRHPLNGRNFEYFSEDPVVTGKIAAAQVRGMWKSGVASTIKHFAGNNQESARRFSDSVISQRALREIYLKGFEIAVKEGGARSVMTTYGSVNGLWTAGSYDLNTTILRKEWAFDGIVMSDWWASANYENRPSDVQVKAPMVRAQNDLYMLVNNSLENPEKDDVGAKLAEGYLTRGMLQRNAMNIFSYLLKSQALLRMEDRIDPAETEAMEQRDREDTPTMGMKYYAMRDGLVTIPGEDLHPAARTSEQVGITDFATGFYDVVFYIRSDLDALAQLSVTVFFDNIFKLTMNTPGLNGRSAVEVREMGYAAGANHFLKLFYGSDGFEIDRIELRLDTSSDPDWKKAIFQQEA